MVYSDDTIVAFLDIKPVTRGHTLVVPRTHAARLGQLAPALAGRMFQIGQRLAQAARQPGLAAHGANLVVNDGTAAFQTVDHVHLHVIPRHRGDKIRLASGLVLRRNHDPQAAAGALISGLEELTPGRDG